MPPTFAKTGGSRSSTLRGCYGEVTLHLKLSLATHQTHIRSEVKDEHIASHFSRNLEIESAGLENLHGP